MLKIGVIFIFLPNHHRVASSSETHSSFSRISFLKTEQPAFVFSVFYSAYLHSTSRSEISCSISTFCVRSSFFLSAFTWGHIGIVFVGCDSSFCYALFHLTPLFCHFVASNRFLCVHCCHLRFTFSKMCKFN